MLKELVILKDWFERNGGMIKCWREEEFDFHLQKNPKSNLKIFLSGNPCPSNGFKPPSTSSTVEVMVLPNVRVSGPAESIPTPEEIEEVVNATLKVTQERCGKPFTRLDFKEEVISLKNGEIIVNETEYINPI